MTGTTKTGEAARFAAGDVVALRADAKRVGPIVAIRETEGGSRYSVFFAAGDVREYDGDQLVLSSEPTTAGLEHALAQARWLAPAEFRALLTAKRLARPENDSLYSLTAARINFIPFQFKPLIRILNSDQHRLFIADEVGVGKTIEAGLILKELDSRTPLENVLIVCPKALTQKWRAEMRRFDEEFEILTSETLKYCLQETHNDGVWPARYRRAIVHLELLRNEQYLHGKDVKRGGRRHGLFTLEPPPAFSMLILDEAHHVRNTETSSYELLQFLSEHSDAAVFLSATPVHTGAHNLFALLQLLREDRFLDKATFDQIVEPNRHLVDAVGFIRSKQPNNWQELAGGALATAAATWWGQNVLGGDPRFTAWRDRLVAGGELSDNERIACLRDLEESHTLADVMNRTRRRDIGTTFTLRDPVTVEVDFTDPQRDLYELLVDFRRAAVAANHDPQVARLVADMLERQASSCLPVLIPLIENYVTRGTFELRDVTDDPGEFDDNDYAIGNLPDHVRAIGRDVIEAAKRVPLDEDPKLDRFLAIVDDVMAEADGPRKVLGFSFFLRTLAYLEHHLRARGIRVATISGKVPDDERESLRDRFRLPNDDPRALDVLLSSEVGCEGLDYEFCNRLINYDLPWNPMRVEQRIGRIDRYGQKSPSVKIYNFITPGTVEERIFFRCFERLGVFRETVGDLDGILGDLVQELERTAFSTKLTAEQAAEAAQQLADNQLRLVEEQQRLEAHSDALIGLDTRVLGEVDDVVKQHRFVSGDELQALVAYYFAEVGAPNALSATPDAPGCVRLKLNKEHRAQLRKEVGRFSRRDRSTAEFDRWLGGSENEWAVTFDQTVAVDQRSMPFITPVHVLARVAVEELARRAQPLVTSFRASSTLPAGRYLFSLEAWETIAIRRELRVVPFVVDTASGERCPAVENELLALLRQARPPHAEDDARDESSAARAVDRFAAEQRRLELDLVAARNDELIDRRIASLTAFRDSQLRRAEVPSGDGAHELVARMKRGQRERIEQDFIDKTRELESRRDTDIDRQPLAMGVLEIEHAG